MDVAVTDDPDFWVKRLTGVAGEYCEFIESLQKEGEPVSSELLSGLGHLLPRLHAAVALLGDSEVGESYMAGVDMDRRFAMYSSLRRYLGDLDAYWMEFDVARDGQEKSGSLADDLTDIYWELKLGLQALEEDRAQIMPTLRSWGTGFRVHWGQHLVDAERHLYALMSRRVV